MKFRHSILWLYLLAPVGLSGCGKESAPERTGPSVEHRPLPARSFSDEDVDELVRVAMAEPARSSESAGSGVVSASARATWSEFRRAHPYHIQTLAVTPADERGRRTLILAEPPPHLERAEWDAVVYEAFPGRVEALGRERHGVGYDGWVEDLVAELRLPPDDDGVLALRSGIEALNLVCFDTIYKTHALRLPAGRSGRMDQGAPALDVSAAELMDWLVADPVTLRANRSDERRSLTELMEEARTGVWRGEGGAIVVWLIDRVDGIDARGGEFREFALETDAIVGAVARGDRSLAVVGRARQVPLDRCPPLRFEEVCGLARASNAEELAPELRTEPPLRRKDRLRRRPGLGPDSAQ